MIDNQPERRRPFGHLQPWLAAATTASVVLAACSARQNPAAHSADVHADAAGAVMTRGVGPIPANDAAWEVAGTNSDTTIDALVAEGTTYAGKVVLRVSVHSSEFDTSTTCYQYTFTHSSNDGQPTRLSQCPNHPALALTSPAPNSIDSTTAAKLADILTSVPATARNDASAIDRALTQVFGPTVTVVTDSSSAGIQIILRAGSQCLNATLPPSGVPTVSNLIKGTDCLGG